MLLKPNPGWSSILVEVRSLWEPTPHESSIRKGAQSLKEANPYGNQSLLEINHEEIPIFEGVKILFSPLFVAIQSLWKPYPCGSPILEPLAKIELHQGLGSTMIELQQNPKELDSLKYWALF